MISIDRNSKLNYQLLHPLRPHIWCFAGLPSRSHVIPWMKILTLTTLDDMGDLCIWEVIERQGKEKVIRQKISKGFDLSHVPLVRVKTVPAAAVSSYTLLSRHPMFLLINNPTDSADDLFPKFSINSWNSFLMASFFKDQVCPVNYSHVINHIANSLSLIYICKLRPL